ncbi:MAG: Rpn family recombination-promoting nuclease/putative transposase, partial [Deltaproteobacteria bacterium]|nr:Rpn family recombination-promoting nuclease/putative transposase [Deltaproteobacteria bacterium]
MFTRLDPKLDVVFKLLFTRPGSEGILIALLSAILRPPSPIRSIKVLNPDLEKEAIPDRGVVLDIRVRLEDGKEVDVEMQSQTRPGMTKRALYHWSRMYGAQIVRGQEYAELQPCISIFLLGYKELPSAKFHSTFQVLEVQTHEPLADQL